MIDSSNTETGSTHFFELAPKVSRPFWVYFAGILLVGVGSILATVVLLIAYNALGLNAALGIMQSQLNWVDITPEQDGEAIAGLAFLFLSLASLVVITPLVARLLHKQPIKSLFTARSSFSWNLFFASGGIYMGMQLILFAVAYAIDPSAVEYVFDGARYWPFFIVVILLVPLQCLGEEVLFRGYIQQGVSQLTSRVAFRLLVPALMFTGMHATNPDWAAGGVAAVALYLTLGTYLGFLALKFNGLEACAGLHTANNLLSFSFITSSGAGFPVATVFYDPSPSYTESFIFVVPVLMTHYFFLRRLTRSALAT